MHECVCLHVLMHACINIRMNIYMCVCEGHSTCQFQFKRVGLFVNKTQKYKRPQILNTSVSFLSGVLALNVNKKKCNSVFYVKPQCC